MKYLVWSNGHGAWWAKRGLGYTLNLDEAQRYTAEDAARVCIEASAHGMLSNEDGSPPEVRVVAPECRTDGGPPQTRVSRPVIPPQIACPFCGGYVRGHLWIGTDRCSVSEVFPEPITEYGRCDRCGDPHACPPPPRWDKRGE